MTTTTRRPMALRIGPNPVSRHLMRLHARYVLPVWAAFTVAVAAVGAAIHLLFGASGSIWSAAASIPSWFALGAGVFLGGIYLPAYIAQGQTRRKVAVGSLQFGAALAALLATLLTVGYAIEAAAYRLLGLTAMLPDPHPLGSPGRAALTFADHGIVVLVHLAVGALVAAAFYRKTVFGTLSLPVGLGMLVVVAWPDQITALLAVGVPTLLGALVATWLVVRDMPLRGRPS